MIFLFGIRTNSSSVFPVSNLFSPFSSLFLLFSHVFTKNLTIVRKIKNRPSQNYTSRRSKKCRWHKEKPGIKKVFSETFLPLKGKKENLIPTCS